MLNNMGVIEGNSYRYERKFFISDLTKYEVESFVTLHSSMFSEIYHQRFVNNIYFDSFKLSNFFDNIDGNAHRIKFRIRWYGNLFGYIEKPVLELKVKNGLGGIKEIYSLLPFKLDNNFNTDAVFHIINTSDVDESVKLRIKTLRPILLNRYKRKYYQSVNRKFRITIDTEQIFYDIGSQDNVFINKYTYDINVILELKYDRKFDSYAHLITNHFPFRITKSSKYVKGIEKILNQVY